MSLLKEKQESLGRLSMLKEIKIKKLEGYTVELR
jgi:hypothetical protein